MSKKNEQSNVAMMEPPATALATATAGDFGGGLTVHGKNDTGSNLSRVVMFQGTAEEEKMYGSHKRGVFLDALEVRELGETISIMPVFAFAQWSIWEEGAKQPKHVWNKQEDVPADLLEWTETDGKRNPPQAQESINVVCCVNGEQWPYLMTFKKTSLRAFQKTILPLEARRGQTNRCPGLYALGGDDDKNDAGQAFKRLTARPAGEPSPELTALAKTVFAAQQKFRAKAAEMAKEDPGAFDPLADQKDGIPV